jgi:hypothetical protein
MIGRFGQPYIGQAVSEAPPTATAVFAETLDNFQHSTRLIPENRSCTLNSSRYAIQHWNFYQCVSRSKNCEKRRSSSPETRLAGKEKANNGFKKNEERAAALKVYV